jgi:hypothetical protein
MGRQRNNVAKLPASARFRVSQLLDDGATYDAVRADAEIAAACEARKLALHNNSIAAFAESAEHAANLADLRTWKTRVGRRRWAAKAIASEEGAASLADVAQIQILEQLSQLAEGGIELTGADVCKVANSIAAMQRVELARRQEAADTRLADAEARHAAEIGAKDAEITILRQAIAGLEGALERARNDGKAVDGAAVADKLNDVLGVKKA